MSAYIVEDKTINRIVNRLVYEIRNFSFSQDLDENLSKLGYDPVNNSFPEKLAQDMYALNVSAVNQRYKKTEPVPNFKYFKGAPASLVQTLKSLNCWVYQCTEGYVPQSGLYKFFTEVFQNYLLKKIVYEMPEYDSAEWA
jgi:hypothetical protein